MALLETALLMAAQATAAPPPAKSAAPPPLELLEFLADWSDEDAKLIDAEKKPGAGSAPPKKPRDQRVGDAGEKTP